jgi:hypothetical protein
MTTPAGTVHTPSWVRRTCAATVLVLGLVAAPVMFALQTGRAGPQPRDVEVGVAGPVLVAQAVADRADRLLGTPIDAVVLGEGADPSDDVRDGRLVAAVLIDFRVDQDTLYASPVTDPDLVAELRVRMEAVSSTYGRSLRVVLVPSARSAGTWRGTPYAMVGAWMVLGVAWSVGLSWWRGPLARTTRHAVERFVALTALAVASGVGVAAVVGTSSDASLLLPSVVGALTVAVTAWLVLGCEALLGLAGLGVAVSLLLATAVPLVGLAELSSLPAPWSQLAPLAPPGAALALVRDDLFFGTGVGPRPLVVLASWALVGVLTVVAARLERGAGASGT